MNKIWVLAPNENWIVDRQVSEWYDGNADISTKNIVEADVIWLAANWCWTQLPERLLSTKKVVTTIHHIVPEKFLQREFDDFLKLDRLTTYYHVPNVHTRKFIERLTSKPIATIPYWGNSKIWKKTGNKADFRRKYKIPVDSYAIGSFVRDTEGIGISENIFLPKKEKGPDIFVDFVEELFFTAEPKLHVVLAGWRRQYVMQQLSAKNIPYTYIELPSQTVINELYQAIDLYPVTARHEGGPQSLIEAGLLNVPVISRSVGMAEQLLLSSSINDCLMMAKPSIPVVEHLKLPSGFEPYRQLFNSL